MAATTQHLNSAEQYIGQGDYAAAQAALDLARQYLIAADALPTAHYHWLQAVIYYHTGQTELARNELAPAHDILEQHPDAKLLKAQVLAMLANIEFMEGHFDAAAAQYKQAAPLAEQAHALKLAAKAWANLGNVHFSRSQMPQALFAFNRAVTLAETVDDATTRNLSYRRLCFVYLRIGPLFRARGYAERILELLPEVTNSTQICLDLIAVATVYLYSSDLDRAASYLDRVLIISNAQTQKMVWASAILKQAEVERERNNLARFCQIASQVFNDPTNPPLVRRDAANLLADCCVRCGQLTKAADLVTWMAQFDHEHELTDYALRYLVAAQLSAAQGDWPTAEAQFQLAIAQCLKQSDMYALGNTYLAYARTIIAHEGQLTATAQENLQHSATAFQRYGAAHQLAEVQQLLANLPPYQQPQRPDASYRHTASHPRDRRRAGVSPPQGFTIQPIALVR